MQVLAVQRILLQVQSDGQVVGVPPEARVVEVDGAQSCAVDQYVVSVQVRVDHAVDLRPAFLVDQAVAQGLAQRPQARSLAITGGRDLPPTTPEGLFAYQALGIAGRAAEARRRCPSGRGVVETCDELAQLPETSRELTRFAGFADHARQRDAREPAHQPDVARAIRAGERDRRVGATVTRQHGLGNRQSRSGHRSSPLVFGFELGEVVITVAMDA